MRKLHKFTRAHPKFRSSLFRAVFLRGNVSEVSIQASECYGAVLAGGIGLRKYHKRLGCRKRYHELKPVGMARDSTAAFLLSSSFGLKRKRSYHRTTYDGKTGWPNLISGLELSAINQLWVRDITYILVLSKS